MGLQKDIELFGVSLLNELKKTSSKFQRPSIKKLVEVALSIRIFFAN